MKIIAILIAVIISLMSCESDNFHDVTKKLTLPDRIEINKPFEFTVGLVNYTNKPIKLTLDKDILKSLFFRPAWSCGK